MERRGRGVCFFVEKMTGEEFGRDGFWGEGFGFVDREVLKGVLLSF